MQVIPWMEARVPGFQHLSEAEREAPMHFSLLWSYFEAEVLNRNASAAAIAAWIQALNDQGRLRVAEFDPALAYFRQRYVANGQFTYHFNTLFRGKADFRPMVEEVLLQDNLDRVDGVKAVFVIIYRFRNNFFHGNKWAYHLQGQLQKFEVSTIALMHAMEM
jgi:hypothetical protein